LEGIDALRHWRPKTAFTQQYLGTSEELPAGLGTSLCRVVGHSHHKRARGSLKRGLEFLEPTFSSPGRFPDATYCMTELGEIFAELGISHYLNEFIEQGFDTWDTILDITESDFDALGVKLGHRRKLQRKIANSRGLSSDRALASPRHTPSEDRQPEDQRAGGTKADAREGGAAHGAKRKYRRHPKPDENAPERPPSAYVIFSNKMREDLKGRNLSFTEIAKLVGENWQNLAPEEKEPYEQQASSAKEKYNNELAEYKKTNSYKEYSQYLAEFKARQSNQQQGTSTITKLGILNSPANSCSYGLGSCQTPET